MHPSPGPSNPDLGGRREGQLGPFDMGPLPENGQEPQSSENCPGSPKNELVPAAYQTTPTNLDQCKLPANLPIEQQIKFRDFEFKVWNHFQITVPYPVRAYSMPTLSFVGSEFAKEFFSPEICHTTGFQNIYPRTLNNFVELIKTKLGPIDMENIDLNLVNQYMESLLPVDLRDHLTPLVVEDGNMSFWSSISLDIFGGPEFSELLRCSVIHYVLTNPSVIESLCDLFCESKEIVLDSLKLQHPPCNVSKAVISHLIDKNITQFQFDLHGKLIDGQYFDHLIRNGSHVDTLFVGSFGDTYFPLVKKFSISNPPRATTSALPYKNTIFIQKILEEEPVQTEILDSEKLPTTTPTNDGQEPAPEVSFCLDEENQSLETFVEIVPERPHEIHQADIACVDYTELGEYSASQSTVVSQDNNGMQIEVEFFYASPNVSYSKNLTVEHLDPYILKQIQQLFLTCRDCKIFDMQNCEHSEKLTVEAYEGLRHFFAKSSYAENVPEIIPAHLRLSKCKFPKALQSCFNGYRVINDGNGFFAALSVTLILDPYLGKAFRRCGLLALKSDSFISIISKMDKKKIEDQIKILSRDGAPPKSNTVFVLSYILSRPIIIYTYNTFGTDVAGTVYNASDSIKPALCIWLNNCQFVPLIRKRKTTVIPRANEMSQDFAEDLAFLRHLKRKRSVPVTPDDTNVCVSGEISAKSSTLQGASLNTGDSLAINAINYPTKIEGTILPQQIQEPVGSNKNGMRNEMHIQKSEGQKRKR